MIADLHSHSTASDGELTPEQLLSRAKEQGVELMAITDHDTLAGYCSVDTAAFAPMTVISGIELSCVWGKTTIHVVGLNVDVTHKPLLAGVEQQAQARHKRAIMIAEKLEKKGFTGAYEATVAMAAGRSIGRPDFARFLVDNGYVATMDAAFKRYLGSGKIGDVKMMWPELATAVQWIKGSGGVAVLAHPLHYKMTNTKLRALVADFQRAGGQAIEVMSGKQQNDRIDYLAKLADQFSLHASIGSDYHGPNYSWCELGAMGTLPKSCRPVWELFA